MKTGTRAAEGPRERGELSLFPLVSVIIPAYRRPELLGRAVRSVLSQTYSRIEVVVVDDASPDDLREQVDELNVPGVRYIRHERNRGACAARNTGLHAGSGDLVGFLDSDDEWLPEKAEVQVRAFAEAPPEVALVYCGCRYVFGDAHERVTIPEAQPDLHRALLTENLIPTPTALVKRTVLEGLRGFDEALPSSQDHDLWLRLTEGHSAVPVPEALVRVHIANDIERISSDPTARREGTLHMLETYGPAMRRHGVEHLYLRNQGRFAASRASRDMEGARRWYRESIRSRPTALGSYVWLIASYLPTSVYDRLGNVLDRLRSWRSGGAA